MTPRYGRGHCLKPDKLRKEKLMRWAQVNRQLLAACNPKLPGLYNRKTDTWRLLAAIAELADGPWPQTIKSVVALLAKMDDESASFSVLLLRDIRRIFKHTKQPVLRSKHLVEYLADLPNRPWSAFKGDKPIMARQLASLLRPFGIRPRTQRSGRETFKGYKRSQLKGAFSRYLDVSVTRSPITSSRDDPLRSKKRRVVKLLNRQRTKPVKHRDCDRVTDQEEDKDFKVQTTAADQAMSFCSHCSGWGCNQCEDTGMVASRNT
jgi:hypothetical protein